MTDVHAGCRIPPSEMDEIPMSNSTSRATRSRPMEGISTGQYQRRLDAENYLNYVVEHRFAIVVGVSFFAICIAFAAIITYLVIKPDKNYAAVEINKVVEVEYPGVTEETDAKELESSVGSRIPVFELQDELPDDMMDVLYKSGYRISDGQSNRLKREIEVESIESCKERHENCKILLDKIKKLTKNVSQQVNQLQKLINKVGLMKGQEEIPSLSNITALDYAICLKCEKLEKENSRIKIADFPPLDVEEVHPPGESRVNDTISPNDGTSLIHGNQTAFTTNIENFGNGVSNASKPDDEKPNEVQTNPPPLKSQSLNDSDTNIPDQVQNEVDEAKMYEDTVDSEKPDDEEEKGFFFSHSQLNRTLGKDQGMSGYLNMREKISVTTEESVEMLTNETTVTTTPASEWEEILSTDSTDPKELPQGKSSYEPNPLFVPTFEATKTSQQMTFTPSVTWMPYPLCIFGPSNPGHQSVRESPSSESITFPVTSPASLTTQEQQFQHGESVVLPTVNGQTYYHYPNFVQPVQPFPAGQPPVQFVPVQYQPPSAPVPPPRYGPTGPGVQYFPVNQGNQQPAGTGQARPIHCTYLPTPTFQFPVIPGVSEFQRTATSEDAVIEEKELKSRDYAAGCPPMTRACGDRSGCIPKLRWCDGRVDCLDASDETHCSCRDRVDKERLCDGYFDCPLGEDELGCFGCDKNMFSCDDSERPRRWGDCLPIEQRCDGYAQCSNGKDEFHCNIITHSVEQREMFTVGYTAGYLHRNWRGKWYPACSATSTWANDACRVEIGEDNYRDFPKVETVPLQQQYNGPYVVQVSFNELEIVDTCNNKAVFVTCPEIPCGTRVSPYNDNPLFDFPHLEPFSPSEFNQGYPNSLESYKTVSKDEEAESENGSEKSELGVGQASSEANKSLYNTTDDKDGILGVVGGRPSRPKAWPSLVAINRDGNFHCGGVILDKFWILSAAHCVDGYRKHYFDIRAGMLRRFSYSPMEQSRKVSQIVMHPSYQREIMKNDIALLRLEKPLYFNRWVRPACLPDISTAGPHWRAGPSVDTTCISAGWGSMVERGPDPDHLREVELPILPNCKYLVDQNEAEICAGALQGGRDTCQGDSGGPLMCRNPNSLSQWYVAGIVSHGEGCARPNEPGAYTKVGRFVEWINGVRSQRELPKYGPLQHCPGFYCHSGPHKCHPSKRRCDKTVDCMDAEDELNCPRMGNFPFFRSRNSETEDPLDTVTEASSTTVIESQSETTLQTEITTAISSTGLSSTTQTPSSSTEMTTEQTVTTLRSTEQSEQKSDGTETDIPIEEITISPSMGPIHFTCKNLIQTIDIRNRCDRIVDCEDGTDEENCTCRDYISKINPASICDGHIDCEDNTDEEHCEICKPEEFHCKRSGECVPMSKRCDRKPDCDFNEDELNCLSLTNGKYLITDIDGLPHHNSEGILTIYENGKWMPFCIDRRADKPALLGKQMCSYFGFGACESFNETRMQNAPLEVRESTVENIIPYEYSSINSLATDDEPRCTALYLRCIPTIHTVPLTFRVKGNVIDDSEDTFLWPWHAAVFVDGRYRCSAVLLEPSWLLTSFHCTENVMLNQNYTAALLGVSRSYLEVDGPHQQISVIDEIKHIKNSDAVILHLKHPANMTRHVQPMYLQKRTHPPAESDTCATVGVDENGRTRSIFLKAVIHNCPNNKRCYKDVDQKNCGNETITTPWSGTVVCYGCSGWYPAAVYHKESGRCSFGTKQSLSSIDYMNTNLITGMQEPLQRSEEPNCDGFRCPLGNCLKSEKVCDGVSHCRNGADEDPNFCRERKDRCTNGVNEASGCHCSQSELRCANGQCVPKSAFCDGQVDCTDGTDEPSQCNCAAYLQLTAPNRICDGRRHCLDKSDENPQVCLCKDASFKCDGGSCVPQDFVCDGQPDCPSGEDENHCRTLKTLPYSPLGMGEIVQRSYGVWHSECFSAGALTDNKEAIDLCASIGYTDVKNVTESDESSPDNTPALPILDKFYMVRLNRQTWVVMRDDKAFVSLHPPRETCYRHYVTCA